MRACCCATPPACPLVSYMGVQRPCSLPDPVRRCVCVCARARKRACPASCACIRTRTGLRSGPKLPCFFFFNNKYVILKLVNTRRIFFFSTAQKQTFPFPRAYRNNKQGKCHGMTSNWFTFYFFFFILKGHRRSIYVCNRLVP